MRYEFSIKDEKTVTNDTVKITISATGPADGDRAELEGRVRSVLKKFFQGETKVNWAFAGLNITTASNLPIFTISASARIPADMNDRLQKRADAISSPSLVLTVTSIDQTTPLHLLRAGQQVLRENLLRMANEEVDKLRDSGITSAYLYSIEFTEERASFGKGSMGTANAYYVDVGDGESASAIASQEKISCEAVVIIADSNYNAPQTVRLDQ